MDTLEIYVRSTLSILENGSFQHVISDAIFRAGFLDLMREREGPLFRTKLRKDALPSLNLPISSCEDPEKIKKKKQNSLQRLERIKRREKLKEECQCDILVEPACEDDSAEIVLAAEALMTLHSKKGEAARQFISHNQEVDIDKSSVSTQVTSGDLLVCRSFIETINERGLNTLTGCHSISLLNSLVAIIEKDYGKSFKSHKMPLKHQII